MKTKLNRVLILLLSVLAILCFAVACTAPDGGDDNAHVHDYKIVKYDESKHWFECECGAKANETVHTIVNNVCVCGYEKAADSGENPDDNAGGEGHIHVFNVNERSERYLKSSATCTDKAVYYYSCECGKKGTETFTYGDSLGHDFGEYLDSGDGRKTATCKRAGCNEKRTIESDKNYYTRYGDYIEFGTYPQTIKASDVTVSETANANGYYTGSDGAEYAKVVASPYGNDYKFSDESEVVSGTTYYFKVEPIRWRILSEEGGTALILCDSIIESRAYQSSYSYNGTPSGTTANNYQYSEIRAWLNNEFLTTAFDNDRQGLIKTTIVDNGIESTRYTEDDFTYNYSCENTNDKVFLLSYKEATCKDYGMDHDAREIQTSDYARATGAYMSTNSNYYGNGHWWLRSPSCYYSDLVHHGRFDGYVSNPLDYVSNAKRGVVPALQIQLV